MTTEYIISFCIAAVCIAPVIILGIVQYNSKKPVGFWSGKEPPKSEQITDIRAYNHKHGIMWILYGAGFILCFLSGFLFGEMWGVASSVLAIVETGAGLLGMIAYHNYLDRRYFKA